MNSTHYLLFTDFTFICFLGMWVLGLCDAYIQPSWKQIVVALDTSDGDMLT